MNRIPEGAHEGRPLPEKQVDEDRSQRRYTVAEIDALRRCHDHKYIWGTYAWVPGQRFSQSYTEKEKVAVVEQWVRTSMMAGHTAEDLISSEKVSA